jgi:hypothetical protein
LRATGSLGRRVAAGSGLLLGLGLSPLLLTRSAGGRAAGLLGLGLSPLVLRGGRAAGCAGLLAAPLLLLRRVTAGLLAAPLLTTGGWRVLCTPLTAGWRLSYWGGGVVVENKI